jgi:hypothetical protein
MALIGLLFLRLSCQGAMHATHRGAGDLPNQSRERALRNAGAGQAFLSDAPSSLTIVNDAPDTSRYPGALRERGLD